MDILYVLLFSTVIILQAVIIFLLCRRRKPQILMREGAFVYDNLKKSRLTEFDVMAAARRCGYFNIADVDTAVLEKDGGISILPKAIKRPLEPKDFNFAPVREGMSYVVYHGGRLDYARLASLGFTEKTLDGFLSQHGYRLENVNLVIVSESGRIEVLA